MIIISDFTDNIPIYYNDIWCYLSSCFYIYWHVESRWKS